MELRMLLGLHSGAALELGDETLVLGASPEADVMVADPGVAPVHLRIAPRGAGFVLAPAEGKVFGEDGQEIAGEIELAPGSRFRVGDAWIGFFDVDAPWENWTPPSPAAEPPAFIEAPAPDIMDALAAPDAGMSVAETQAGEEAQAEPEPEAEPDGEQERMPMSRLNAAFTRLTRQWAQLSPGKRRLAATAGVILLAVLIAVGTAANMLFERDTARRKPAKAGGTPSLAGDRAAAGGAESPAASASSPQPATSEALAETFRRELAERDLLERMDLDLRHDRWTIRASLDDEEEGRLHRLLKRFDKIYHPGFPIEVTLVPLKDLLPFKIIEVTSGRGANIVTDQGNRLFVGDSLGGYRLAEIGPGKVVFTGKRHIEVAW